MNKGKPHGAYHEYFEDGSVRESKFYKAGKIWGDFWPDGQLKRRESKQGTNRVIEWFYPNGSIQKRYVKNKDGYAIEPIRLFHPNGQLAEELNTSRGCKRGPWLKYFEDGAPELQAEFVADEKLIIHYAWNAYRRQIVRNGTGTFCDYRTHIDWEYDVDFENHWPRESELKNGIPHGKVATYHRDVLWSIARCVHGKLHGELKTFWDNGRVRSSTRHVNGNAGVPRNFPKFDHPVPAVVLSVKADEKLYAGWQHIVVDEFPRVSNLKTVRRQLKVPQFLRDVHDRNLAGILLDVYEDCNSFADGIAYFLTVDESGQVTSVTANGSGVYSSGEWDTYPPLLRKQRFAPVAPVAGPSRVECLRA